MKRSRLQVVDISFLLFCMLCLVCMGFSVRYPVLNQSFQSAILKMTGPVLKLSQQPGLWVDNFHQAINEYFFVMEKNVELKAQNQHLQTYKKTSQALLVENEELKKLLAMDKEVLGEPITTRLLADGSSPFTRSGIVNVGRKHGVERGQQVVNTEGLVGRVVDVFDDRARVLLLTDYTFRFPVKILESRVQAIVRGTNGSKLELVVQENEGEVLSLMTVVTSGAGGVFSPGIPVGTTDVRAGKIYVVPDVDFSRVDMVSIQRRKIEGILPDEN